MAIVALNVLHRADIVVRDKVDDGAFTTKAACSTSPMEILLLFISLRR